MELGDVLEAGEPEPDAGAFEPPPQALRRTLAASTATIGPCNLRLFMWHPKSGSPHLIELGRWSVSSLPATSSVPSALSSSPPFHRVLVLAAASDSSDHAGARRR